jgi:hypothetical protein
MEGSRGWALGAFAVGACVLAAGCGDAVDDESVGGASVPAVTAELSVQRAKWEAAGVRSYRFSLRWLSMGAAGEFVVSVEDGRPAGVEPADPAIFDGLTVTEREAALRALPSAIDVVFDVLEGVTDAERFEVAYDPVYGFPTAGRIDNDLSMTDDEFEFRLSDLQVD